MKCCVSADVATWRNWLTCEPDPDHSPDVGTGKSENRWSVEVRQTSTSLKAGYRSRDALQRDTVLCLLHVVVQRPGSLSDFSVRRTIAELRGVKLAQFLDFDLFSPYKTSLQPMGYIAEWLRFLPRDAMHKRGLCSMPSCGVCLSVCLSRSWIMSKRIKISSKFFHHRVATPF